MLEQRYKNETIMLMIIVKAHVFRTYILVSYTDNMTILYIYTIYIYYICILYKPAAMQCNYILPSASRRSLSENEELTACTHIKTFTYPKKSEIHQDGK